MTERNILLDSMEKVSKFGRIIEDCEIPIDLRSGRYVVNAHSMIGMFSLDLSSPVTLVLHADQEEGAQILQKLEEFFC